MPAVRAVSIGAARADTLTGPNGGPGQNERETTMSDRTFNRLLTWVAWASLAFILFGLPAVLELTGRQHYTW